jgi:hypothetical protein
VSSRRPRSPTRGVLVEAGAQAREVVGEAPRRNRADGGHVRMPARQVLPPEAVRQDQQAVHGHLHRRIAWMGRDHQRDTDRRLAEQVAVRPQVDLAERTHHQPRAEVDVHVRLAHRDHRPAIVGIGLPPWPQAVDDQGEGVPRLGGPADDLVRPRDCRACEETLPQACREPWCECELVRELQPDPVGLLAEQLAVEHGDGRGRIVIGRSGED